MTRRTARRWLARAALCVALGLATSVAVAWALAAWLPHRHLLETVEVLWESAPHGAVQTAWEYRRPGMARRYWQVALPGMQPRRLRHTLGEQSARHLTIETYVPVLRRDWGYLPTSPTPGRPPRTVVLEDARGLPCLALWTAFEAKNRELSILGGLGLGPPGNVHARALPVRPIWAGLAVNSMFYGLIVFGIWTGGVRVVRNTRRRQGRCTGCGYDRAGLAAEAACPECGK